MKKGFVYILSNKNRTVLYIGVTSNLKKRIEQHKNRVYESFTKRYNVHDLLYYEEIDGMMNAIRREKQLKRWHKEWKWNLIKEHNSELRDLYEDLK